MMALVDALATHLPWARHLGTPTTDTATTAIDHARQHTAELLTRDDAQRRTTHQHSDRTQYRDTVLDR